MKKQVAQFEKDDQSIANGHSEKTVGKKTSFVMPSQMDNAKQNSNFVMPSQIAQARRNPNFVMPSAKTPVPQNPIQKKENTSETALPQNLQTGMESMSGMDLSDVNVHYNSSKPAQLQALAYAQGNDIHVASGQEKHLAHEAWHVVQQKQGRVQANTETNGVPVNDSPALEKEADVMGAKATNGKWDAVQMKKKASSNENNVSQLASDLEKHDSETFDLMSKIKPGRLCTVADFDKMTYEGFFVRNGPAKKKIMSELKWFEEHCAKIVGHTGKDANLRISDFAIPAKKNIYIEAYKRANVLHSVAEVWLNERADDESRQKRAIGLMYFEVMTSNFLLVAKDGLPNIFGTDKEESEKGANEVENQLSEEDEDVKNMRLDYEQRSAKSVFGRLGKLTDTLVPRRNSSASASIKVQIPLAFGGAVALGGELGLGVERDDKNVKVSCKAGLDLIGELKLWKVLGITAKVGVGFFVEAKAPTAEKALTLISYGFYKRLKENAVLGRFADSAWGGAKGSEKFAKSTEKDILEKSDKAKDTYVELGGNAKAGVEGKLGFTEEINKKGEVTHKNKATAKAGYEYSSSTRYDKETIGADKGKKESKHTFSAEGGVAIVLGDGFSGSAKYAFSKEVGKPHKHKFTLAATTTELKPEALNKTLPLICSKTTIAIEKIMQTFSNKDEIPTLDARNIASVADGLATTFPVGAVSPLGSAEIKLAIEKKQGESATATFTLSSTSSSKLGDAKKIGLEGSIEKTQTLFKLKYDKAWSVEAMV